MATEVNLINDDVTAKSLESLEGADAVDVNATGNVTANSFIGDGSQLTNLPNPGVITEACKAFLAANNTVNNNTAFTSLSVFPGTGGLDINLGGFTSAGAGITVPSSGVYIVSKELVYSSGAARPSPESRFTLNGVGQTETSRSGYIRNLGNHDQSSTGLTTIYNLTAGDQIGLEFRRSANTGTVTLENNSVVILYRIG